MNGERTAGDASPALVLATLTVASPATPSAPPPPMLADASAEPDGTAADTGSGLSAAGDCSLEDCGSGDPKLFREMEGNGA